MSWSVLKDKQVAFCTAHLPDIEGAEVRRTSVRDGAVPLSLVRHSMQNCRALWSAGLPVPEPIRYYYDWPGGKTPYDHQVETAAFLTRRRKAFCLNGLGTGKTLSGMWAMDYLIREGDVRRALIVAPLSICEYVWGRELFGGFGHLNYAVLHGSRKRKQQMARDTRFDVLIVNPESLPLVSDHLPAVDLILVDEFTKFKNVSAKRYKALRAAAQDRMLWLFSGTPAPQSPVDAYAPIKLVRDERLTKNEWVDVTMRQVSKFKWVPRDGAEDTIAAWMQPAIRYRREDCYSMPEVAVEQVDVDLTDAQKVLIDKFKEDALAELGGDRVITAPTAASVLLKILQVMGGGVYGTEDGSRYIEAVDASPFFAAVEELVEQADTPMLVFLPFRSSADALSEALSSAGYRVGLVTGDTPKSQRMRHFDAVQGYQLDALVAVAGTMSHGITLTAARYVLWACPPFSFEEYEQANGRVIRDGQRNDVVIYHLVQNTLAKELFRRLESKAALQETVLNLIEEGRK